MEKSLIQELERGLFYLEENNRSVREFLFYKDQINVLIEALDEYGRYKWHDLEKDPSDLPGHEDEYLCRLQHSDGEIYYEVCHFYQAKEVWEQSCGPMYGMVIAWKHIDRSVEVKDGKLGSD